MTRFVRLFQDFSAVYVLPQQRRVSTGAEVPTEIVCLREYIYNLPEQTTWVAAPSNEDRPGFQTLTDPQYGTAVLAEGVILTQPNTAAVIQVADCAVVCLRHRLTNQLAVFHAGRNALDGSKHQPGHTANNKGMARIALETFLQGDSGELCEVYVGPHISGVNFDHSHTGAERHVSWFREQYGQAAFTNWERGRLSLRAVLEAEFNRAGIPTTNVKWDSRCTFSDESLSSYRRNDNHRNTLVVIRK